jgi:cytochrome c oxidase cbb3-type subunit 3
MTMNDPVPNADIDEDKLLHHEYDGIREYDNPLPGWWKTVWFLSFLFSIGYFVHYHLTGNGSSVEQDYTVEMSAAREERAKALVGTKVTPEGLEKLMADPALMGDASRVFVERCAPCHADRGQGLIGPNLTDQYWLHGSGKLMDIYELVDQGVPDKGMPAWGTQLNPAEVQKLAALVGSWRALDVPGKSPQGALVSAKQ